MNEGKLNYKLKFPFSEFVDNNILSEQVAKLHEPMQKQAEQGLQANNNEYIQMGCLKSYEPMQHLAEQRIQGNDNENLQIGDIKSYELAESLKNKRLAKNFASLLQIGDAYLTVYETITTFLLLLRDFLL